MTKYGLLFAKSAPYIGKSWLSTVEDNSNVSESKIYTLSVLDPTAAMYFPLSSLDLERPSIAHGGSSVCLEIRVPIDNENVNS